MIVVGWLPSSNILALALIRLVRIDCRVETAPWEQSGIRCANNRPRPIMIYIAITRVALLDSGRIYTSKRYLSRPLHNFTDELSIIGS